MMSRRRALTLSRMRVTRLVRRSRRNSRQRVGKRLGPGGRVPAPASRSFGRPAAGSRPSQDVGPERLERGATVVELVVRIPDVVEVHAVDRVAGRHVGHDGHRRVGGVLGDRRDVEPFDLTALRARPPRQLVEIQLAPARRAAPCRGPARAAPSATRGGGRRRGRGRPAVRPRSTQGRCRSRRARGCPGRARA